MDFSFFVAREQCRTDTPSQRTTGVNSANSSAASSPRNSGHYSSWNDTDRECLIQGSPYKTTTHKNKKYYRL
jgi:hypothetical protein